MVHVVARHTTHVASVVLAALPVKMTTIARVTLKAGCICPFPVLGRLQFGWVVDVVGGNALFPVLNVLFASAVAGFASRRARVAEEFRSFAVNFETEGIHISSVARNTLVSGRGSPNNCLGGLRVRARVGGLRRGSRPGNRLRLGRLRIRKARKNSDENYQYQ